MSKQVQKLSEKLDSTSKKRLKCTHGQKRRSRRILERKLTIVNKRKISMLKSKQCFEENPSQISPTDENLNLLPTNFQASISDLPNEMLCHIFAQLPFMDRYCIAANVCQRWKANARNPFLWQTIKVDGTMSTVVLLKLLSEASALRNLEITNRRDANAVLRKVIKCCPKIENISMTKCRGSKCGLYISFGCLMKAVTIHKNVKILLNEGTGLSPPPSPNSKIMQKYAVMYHRAGGNLVTIVPILRL